MDRLIPRMAPNCINNRETRIVC